MTFFEYIKLSCFTTASFLGLVLDFWAGSRGREEGSGKTNRWWNVLRIGGRKMWRVAFREVQISMGLFRAPRRWERILRRYCGLRMVQGSLE